MSYSLDIVMSDGSVRTVDCVLTDVPGLVIVPTGLGDYVSITHEPSGTRVLRTRTVRRALDVVRVLGALGIDWTIVDVDAFRARYDKHRALRSYIIATDCT